jgi:hypothetical protein
VAIYHTDVAQYSARYDELKLGLPTSSNFKMIITPVEGRRSSQWRHYAHHLIAERMLGQKLYTYSSPDMEDGLRLEPFAVAWYLLETDTPEEEIQKIGFVTDDARTVGCTPDRLIGDAGLLEVKCPKPTAQVGYLIDGVERTYWPQLQGQLYVAEGREWTDVVAYHEVLDRRAVRIYRDEPYIKKLKAELDHLNDYIEDSMAKIEAKRRGLPPPPDLMERLSRQGVKEDRQGSLDKLKADLVATLAQEDSSRPAGSAAPLGSVEDTEKSGPEPDIARLALDAEETFWDIAARTSDYTITIPDKNIAWLGRDRVMNLIAIAPSVEAIDVFALANKDTLDTMGKVRTASRKDVVKAIERRKRELGA